ncbi:MAG: MotA/TolQ/ExbB proton channel family protein [[Clostridium] fimetarium]|nr:MotA/TolQ/ExbB proton channel family protein [Alistipes timonensis]MCM1405726.1 MotA/TolQ/ExbB proton channel family protein [[Clostridium] fimetarium]
MNVISNILYWISTGLLVPVIVLLIFFFARALLMVGAYFGQWSRARKGSARLAVVVKELDKGDKGAAFAALPAKPLIPAEAYARRIFEAAGSEPKLTLLLNDFELEAEREVATSKTLTKMGPILGLMGTLIPMGPALVGLAQGDIASMAYNMQVAFATTVVGLTVSAIGFLTQQSLERRARADLARLEYIADTLSSVAPAETTKNSAL